MEEEIMPSSRRRTLPAKEQRVYKHPEKENEIDVLEEQLEGACDWGDKGWGWQEIRLRGNK